MHDPSDRTIDSEAYPRRKPGLLRYAVIGLLLFSLITIAASPLITSAFNSAAERAWVKDAERKHQALLTLDYPTPPSNSPITLIHTEHLGGINITTPFLPVATSAKTSGKPDFAGTFFIEARTRRSENEKLRGAVLVTIAGDAANPVPQAQYRTTPLILDIAGAAHAVYSTQWQSEQLAAKFKDDRFATNMVFSIPTELYIGWLKQTTPTASLGPYTLMAPPQARASLIELAAAMKP